MIAKAQLPLLRGAALSADGTTVAWLGANLQSRCRCSPARRGDLRRERRQPFPYDEPLWRRVADGPEAPTRRIVGGDPSGALRRT